MFIRCSQSLAMMEMAVSEMLGVSTHPTRNCGLNSMARQQVNPLRLLMADQSAHWQRIQVPLHSKRLGVWLHSLLRAFLTIIEPKRIVAIPRGQRQGRRNIATKQVATA